jgi:hypothetical protein
LDKEQATGPGQILQPNRVEKQKADGISATRLMKN